jgi:hypothetical protein
MNDFSLPAVGSNKRPKQSLWTRWRDSRWSSFLKGSALVVIWTAIISAAGYVIAQNRGGVEFMLIAIAAVLVFSWIASLVAGGVNPFPIGKQYFSWSDKRIQERMAAMEVEKATIAEAKQTETEGD